MTATQITTSGNTGDRQSYNSKSLPVGWIYPHRCHVSRTHALARDETKDSCWYDCRPCSPSAGLAIPRVPAGACTHGRLRPWDALRMAHFRACTPARVRGAAVLPSYASARPSIHAVSLHPSRPSVSPPFLPPSVRASNPCAQSRVRRCELVCPMLTPLACYSGLLAHHVRLRVFCVCI